MTGSLRDGSMNARCVAGVAGTASAAERIEPMRLFHVVDVAQANTSSTA